MLGCRLGSASPASWHLCPVFWMMGSIFTPGIENYVHIIYLRRPLWELNENVSEVPAADRILWIPPGASPQLQATHLPPPAPQVCTDLTQQVLSNTTRIWSRNSYSKAIRDHPLLIKQTRLLRRSPPNYLKDPISATCCGEGWMSPCILWDPTAALWLIEACWDNQLMFVFAQTWTPGSQRPNGIHLCFPQQEVLTGDGDTGVHRWKRAESV